MNKLIPHPDNHAIAGLLSGSGTELALLTPFQQEIYLTSFYAAGLHYVPEAERLLKQMDKDDPLILVREPANAYDTYAILIQNEEGNKLGYVPRTLNRMPARLMDAGKYLFGKVIELERGKPMQLRVGLYLKD